MDEDHNECDIRFGVDTDLPFIPAVGDTLLCDLGHGVVTARHFKLVGFSPQVLLIIKPELDTE